VNTFAERVEARVAQWVAACRSDHVFMTGDGRVSEADSAKLMGINRGYLKELRHLGKGPHFFRVPLNGSRICYSLTELARWIEEQRDEPGNDG
jgi:hypothetical protein